MQEQHSRKALIIGGGIGGIATAIALKRAGIDVTVLERAHAIQEVGSAIPLWKNALHALQKLEVGCALSELGRLVNAGRISPGVVMCWLISHMKNACRAWASSVWWCIARTCWRCCWQPSARSTCN